METELRRLRDSLPFSSQDRDELRWQDEQLLTSLILGFDTILYSASDSTSHRDRATLEYFSETEKIAGHLESKDTQTFVSIRDQITEHIGQCQSYLIEMRQ